MSEAQYQWGYIGGGRVWARLSWLEPGHWVEMPLSYDANMVTAYEVDNDPKIRALTSAEVERAERGLGPLRFESVTVRDAAGEVIYQEPSDDIGTSYTSAQLAAAVDEAHAALREAAESYELNPRGDFALLLAKAERALHRVGAGLPRVAGATPGAEDAVDIRLTEAEIDAAIDRLEGRVIRTPADSSALAKLRAARGSR